MGYDFDNVFGKFYIRTALLQWGFKKAGKQWKEAITLNYNENLGILTMILMTLIIMTVILRTLPIFVKIPENNLKVNKFFEALPYTVLTVLVFPDIFTSTGSTNFDIIRVLIGMVIVAYLTFKKANLGIIIIVSIAVIYLLGILKGSFI